MQLEKLWVYLLLMLSLLVCSAIEADEILKASVAKYQIHEPNIEPYVSRMIVTQRQIRMDDDEDKGDYLIFSRENGVIESVNHDEQSILVINPRDISASPPFLLKQKVERVQLSDAPAVSGIAPQQFQLSVNGEYCQSVVSVDGLLTDTVEAWGQFRRVLAGEHAAMIPYTSADQQSGCDLAMNTFSPVWFLDFGLPIQSLEVGGKGMVLVDYTLEEMISPELFTLPDGYRRYSAE